MARGMPWKLPLCSGLALALLQVAALAAGSTADKLLPHSAGTRYKLPDTADHPLVSSLEPWNASFTGPHSEERDFYIFKNVMLSVDSLRFYHVGSFLPPLPESPPASLRLSRYEDQLDLQIQVVTQENRHQHPQHCSRWEDRPALLFAGSPWDDNIAEFFSTQYMPMWQTAVQSGLLDPDHAEQLLQLPRQALAEAVHSVQGRAPFVLISGRPQSFEANWGYLFDHLSHDQWGLPGLQRVCFSKLVVSEDAVLRYLYERVVEMQDPAYVAYRARWFARFQRHLFAVERLHARLQQVDWPLPPAERLPGRPRVTFISRHATHRRAVLNQDEVMDAIRAGWDVEVVSTNFSMPLREAVTLMQRTDLLVGMHGAGIVNAFWMRNGSALLQLLPYGWEVYPGQLIRSFYSQDVPLAINGSYIQWVNPLAQNAHLNVVDFDNALANWKEMWGSKPAGYQPHPTPELALPTGPDAPHFWLYQNTWVDLPSLQPSLERAMQAVDAQCRRRAHLRQ